jgi:hypothetical protein
LRLRVAGHAGIFVVAHPQRAVKKLVGLAAIPKGAGPSRM